MLPRSECVRMKGSLVVLFAMRWIALIGTWAALPVVAAGVYFNRTGYALAFLLAVFAVIVVRNALTSAFNRWMDDVSRKHILPGRKFTLAAGSDGQGFIAFMCNVSQQSVTGTTTTLPDGRIEVEIVSVAPIGSGRG